MKHLKQIFALIALTIVVSFSINAQSKIDQNFSGITEIDISTGSSDCVIKKGSGNEINVKLDHDFGDGFKPTVEKRGSTLVIKESNHGNSRGGQAQWTLTVPNNMDLEFNTGSGSFEASNLDMTLHLNAGSGDFNLENMKGDITSNSGSGDLALDDFSGELESNTGSGEMEIDNAEGKISLNCGSGGIELSKINAAIKANVGSGDITAEEVILTGKGHFNSGSGDVMVHLAESPKHDITANSGSGDAVLDFNGNAINGTVVMTANKKNGTISAPFPFDKEEEIDNGSRYPTIMKTAKLGNSSVEIKVGTGSGLAKVAK